MKLPVQIKDGVRAFAVACVAVIAAYVMLMGYRLNETLAGPTWCSTAIGADRATDSGRVDVAKSCVDLLTIQLKSVATNSHILLGTVAMCLLVLVVVVIAGARLAGKFHDASIDIASGDTPLPVQVTNPPAQPVPTTPVPEPPHPPEPTGPAMPPPV